MNSSLPSSGKGVITEGFPKVAQEACSTSAKERKVTSSLVRVRGEEPGKSSIEFLASPDKSLQKRFRNAVYPIL